ncbi:MAG: ribonuclease H [Candidatus Gracilibacteria bacterium]
MKQIKIYTDGSSKGNPGPGGWAFVVLADGSAKTRSILCASSGGEDATTNNRMEIMGAIEALEWVRKNFARASLKIDLFSDSSLLIKTMRGEFKSKKNLDLWRELAQLAEGLNIKWNWVKGHATDKYNNMCDKLAQDAADKVEPAVEVSDKDVQGFYCPKCKKETDGILTQKTSDSPIRVDCTHCGKYIKFAEKTEENLGRVKDPEENSLF